MLKVKSRTMSTSSKRKPKPTGPGYAAKTLVAIVDCSHFGKGAIRQAIQRHIAETHEGCSSSALRVAMKKLVDSGAVEQDGLHFKITGSGKASASKAEVAAKKYATRKSAWIAAEEIAAEKAAAEKASQPQTPPAVVYSN